MSLDRKDRSTIAKKWLEFKSTEYNPLTGQHETHSQEEWMLIRDPEFKKIKKQYG